MKWNEDQEYVILYRAKKTETLQKTKSCFIHFNLLRNVFFLILLQWNEKPSSKSKVLMFCWSTKCSTILLPAKDKKSTC